MRLAPSASRRPESLLLAAIDRALAVNDPVAEINLSFGRPTPEPRMRLMINCAAVLPISLRGVATELIAG